jgi:hypothetical protein
MLAAIGQSRSIPRLAAALAVALGLALAGGACAPFQPAAEEAEVICRAESERASRLEVEIELLRADLVEAERELVAMESGLRGSRTLADAISALAAARIEVERASKRAPWRASRFEEAEGKLDEAERLIEGENFGAAVFFASRAERIARTTLEEARKAESEPGVRAIGGSRVNLREGPSTGHAVLAVLLRGTPIFPEKEEEDWVLIRTTDGSVGWVHASLIR